MSDDLNVGHQTVEGRVQPDGSMVFLMGVPPTASTVEVAGAVFHIPPGATTIRVVVSMDDEGQVTYRMRPGYEGDTTT